MDSRKQTAPGSGVLDDLKQTFREIRDIGDDLARQGRLRMDVFQTERRLKAAYTALGEASFDLLSQAQPVPVDDAAIRDMVTRIRYYHDELSRLRKEQHVNTESFN